jgi:hypothetical protein
MELLIVSFHTRGNQSLERLNDFLVQGYRASKITYTISPYLEEVLYTPGLKFLILMTKLGQWETERLDQGYIAGNSSLVDSGNREGIHVHVLSLFQLLWKTPEILLLPLGSEQQESFMVEP